MSQLVSELVTIGC